MADFDVNSLLENPLLQMGISLLGANKNQSLGEAAGQGIANATTLKKSRLQSQLSELQAKQMQSQMNFNPADYLTGNRPLNPVGVQVGAPVGEGTGTPGTNLAEGVAPGVAPAPQTAMNMQGLLRGGLAAGYSPQQIQAIAGLLDPHGETQRMVEQQQALQQLKGYNLSPGEAHFENGQMVAQNTAPPPGGLAQTIQQLSAQRDAALAKGDQANAQVYQLAIEKATGAMDERQFQQNFAENHAMRQQAQESLDAQRDATNVYRQEQMMNARAQRAQQQATQFSNQLQKIGLPQAQQQLDFIDQTLSKYKTGDIPGFTKMDSLLPNAMLGEEGQQARQAVASFANVLLKTRSGAAVTDPEQRRFLEEMGTGKWMSSDRLRQGLKMMHGLLDAEKRNAAAGVSNDVLDSYMATPGAMDFGAFRKTGQGEDAGGAKQQPRSFNYSDAMAEARRRGLIK